MALDKMYKNVDKLESFYRQDEIFPPSVFMFGLRSTGKKWIAKQFVEQNQSWLKFATVQANECYTSKILFETIINQFYKHELTIENGFESYAKIENIEDFLHELANLDKAGSYVIIIQDAEKLRDMESNILPVLLHLKENTHLNLSTLFISHLPPEKLALPPMLKIYVPNHSKEDMVDLMLTGYGEIFNDIMRSIDIEGTNVDEKRQLAVHLDDEFYKQFLNIFLNVTLKTCRDYEELKPLAERCFKSYYAPVLSGEIRYNDVTNLWRNISGVLKSSISGGSYMKIKNISMKDLEKENMEIDDEGENEESHSESSNLRTFAQNLELPFYAKYLLIASFLASHNDAKYDKRLFMKHHGKERKRANKPAAVEKMNTQFGPKSFTIDRLLAIFYAILDEKVGLTCNLLAQISTLVDLNFLSFVSGEANIMDGSAKLQSTIGMDFAVNIGKVVGFNVKQYLTDFY